jgi:hypothetical protein
MFVSSNPDYLSRFLLRLRIRRHLAAPNRFRWSLSVDDALHRRPRRHPQSACVSLARYET